MAKKKKSAGKSGYSESELGNFGNNDGTIKRTKRMAGSGRDRSGRGRLDDEPAQVADTQSEEARLVKDQEHAALEVLEDIALDGETTPETIERHLKLMAEKALQAGVSLPEIALLHQYFAATAGATANQARIFKDRVLAFQDLNLDDLSILVGDYQTSVRILLQPQFEAKKKIFMAKQLRGQKMKDRREKIRELVESFENSDPYAALKELESAMVAIGIDEDAIKPMRDPTLLLPEEEFLRKKEEFARRVAMFQAKIQTLVDQDSKDELSRFVAQLNERANTDLDGAQSELEDMERSIEPSRAQFEQLLERYHAKALQLVLADTEHEAIQNYKDAKIEEFEDSPLAAFQSLQADVEEMEKRLHEKQLVVEAKVAQEKFEAGLEELKNLYLQRIGKSKWGELSVDEKNVWKRKEQELRQLFANDSTQAETELARLKQRQLERMASNKTEAIERDDFESELNWYLRDFTFVRKNIGVPNARVKDERREARAKYLRAFEQDKNEARARLENKRELAASVIAYITMLSNRGLKGNTKARYVEDYDNLLTSEDIEDRELAQERLQIEVLMAEWLARAEAANLDRKQIRQAKDWLNTQLSLDNVDLDDIAETLKEEIAKLPSSAEEETADDITHPGLVIEGNVDPDEVTETRALDNTDSISAVPVAAAAAAGAVAGAAAAAAWASGEHDPDADGEAHAPVINLEGTLGPGPTKGDERKKNKKPLWRQVGELAGTPIAWVAQSKAVDNRYTRGAGFFGGIVGGGAFYGIYKFGKGIWNFGRVLLGFDDVKVFDDDKKEKK